MPSSHFKKTIQKPFERFKIQGRFEASLEFITSPGNAAKQQWW